MATFKVKGGIKLKGDLHPQGAKNEALQVLCAVLLSPKEVVKLEIPTGIPYCYQINYQGEVENKTLIDIKIE